jgi:single-strand DNA-binding protein
MASVNRVTLIGNLGRDPEMRYLPSGEAVASFSVATTETWKDKSGAKQERTDWHRVEFIGRLAEVAGEYLKKGRSCYVEGRIQYDKWTDKEGVEKMLTKIRGDKLTLLGGKRDDSSGGESASESDEGDTKQQSPRSNTPRPSAAQAPKKSKLDDFDDDIPF